MFIKLRQNNYRGPIAFDCAINTNIKHYFVDDSKNVTDLKFLRYKHRSMNKYRLLPAALCIRQLVWVGGMGYK